MTSALLHVSLALVVIGLGLIVIGAFIRWIDEEKAVRGE